MFSSLDSIKCQTILLDMDDRITQVFEHFDITISDLSEEGDIANDVADLLQVDYLGKAVSPPKFPVYGRPYIESFGSRKY